MIYITLLIAAVAFAMTLGDTPPAMNMHMADIAFFGAVVNQATLETLGKSFKAIFSKAYQSIETPLMNLAMSVTSTNKTEEYGWLKAMTELREWIGDRQVEKLAVDGYSIKNQKFEKTISVSREDIEDDRIGMYEPRIQMLADLAKRHPGKLLLDLLSNGESTTCYDGAKFFDTLHPVGDTGNYSNLLVASPLDSLNYETARMSMMSYVSDGGETLGLVPNTLIVPPQLEATARTILHAGTVVGSATAGGSKQNIWLGSANLVVEPRLAAQPTEWYLAALDMPFKPFIFQTRREVELTSMDRMEDQNVFFKDEYLYGVSYRGAAGYGLPFMIVKGRA